jgi:hypothetical protein
LGFWTDETVYAGGIDLLVDYFQDNDLQFNITNCKTKEEADKFFDYRNNLREGVDRKVYQKLAEKRAGVNRKRKECNN